MSAVLLVASPVFGIVLIGVFAGLSRQMTGAESRTLNKFIFRFAMPAALFSLTVNAAPPGKDDLPMIAAYGAAALATMVVTYGLARRFLPVSGPQAGAHAFTSTLGNAVFLGLPIALAIEGWARPFIFLMLIEGTMVIALGAALMAPSNATKSRTAQLFALTTQPLRNPLVLGMLGGFAYAGLGLPLPAPAATLLDYFAKAVGPIALFSLGLFLSTPPFPDFKPILGRILSITAAKLILLPFLALSFAFGLGVDDPAQLGALALFVFVPSAVGAFIISSQYGVYEIESAAAVAATTLLSMFTISGVLIAFAP